MSNAVRTTKIMKILPLLLPSVLSSPQFLHHHSGDVTVGNELTVTIVLLVTVVDVSL